MKCTTCRSKDVELLTKWERIRHWLFERINHIFFPDDFDDLKNDRYTQGFADGRTAGMEYEKKTFERMKFMYTDGTPVPSLKDMVQKEMETLLSPIDTRMIATIKDRQILIGDERVERPRLLNLKSEAEFLLNSDIWNLLHETPKALAEKAMFTGGDDTAFMQKGRTMLFTLKTQKNIVDLFASVESTPPIPPRSYAPRDDMRM